MGKKKQKLASSKMQKKTKATKKAFAMSKTAHNKQKKTKPLKPPAKKTIAKKTSTSKTLKKTTKAKTKAKTRLTQAKQAQLKKSSKKKSSQSKAKQKASVKTTSKALSHTASKSHLTKKNKTTSSKKVMKTKKTPKKSLSKIQKTSIKTKPKEKASTKTGAKTTKKVKAQKTQMTPVKVTKPKAKVSAKAGAKTTKKVTVQKTQIIPTKKITQPKTSIKKRDPIDSNKQQKYDAIEEAFNEEQVILTNAEGQKFCYDKECDQPATVGLYCRKHYLLLWPLIQQKKQILEGNKLETFIKEITARYPDKFLEMIRKNLSTERDFMATLQELEIAHPPEPKDSHLEDSSLHFTEDIPISR